MIPDLINTPGVARAVLQTMLVGGSLIVPNIPNEYFTNFSEFLKRYWHCEYSVYKGKSWIC